MRNFCKNGEYRIENEEFRLQITDYGLQNKRGNLQEEVYVVGGTTQLLPAGYPAPHSCPGKDS